MFNLYFSVKSFEVIEFMSDLSCFISMSMILSPHKKDFRKQTSRKSNHAPANLIVVHGSKIAIYIYKFHAKHLMHLFVKTEGELQAVITAGAHLGVVVACGNLRPNVKQVKWCAIRHFSRSSKRQAAEIIIKQCVQLLTLLCKDSTL